MANIRQYIGARYVIKIYENSQDPSSAEWEQGNYEPLVMVTWQNGSYLSKKDVPGTVGNPASNPNYWVQTGFYNGQIAALQQQIDTINNTTIPGIESDIEELENISKERIVCVGDSYPDNGDTFNRAAALVPSNKYAIESYTYGGASFSKTDQAGYTSYKSILESATIANPESVNRVLIMGGYNEINLTNNIVQGVADTVSYLRTRFPNAILEYMPVGRSKSANYNMTVQKYDNIAIREFKKNGGIVYENAKYILSSANLMNSDNVHPSTEGYSELVKYTVNVIVNKSLDVYNAFEIENIGAASGLPFSITGNMWFNQHNEKCVISSKNLVITKTSGSGRWTVAAGGRASFIDMPNFFINNDASVSAPVQCDYPFRQTNTIGAYGLKVQTVQNITGLNVCNYAPTSQALGVSDADDASGTTNMSAELKLEFSLNDQFPKYPLSWIGY